MRERGDTQTTVRTPDGERNAPDVQSAREAVERALIAHEAACDREAALRSALDAACEETDATFTTFAAAQRALRLAEKATNGGAR